MGKRLHATLFPVIGLDARGGAGFGFGGSAGVGVAGSGELEISGGAADCDAIPTRLRTVAVN